MEQKKKVQKRIRDLILIIAGTFILAISVEMFIIPYSILSGGVAGIAVAIEPLFHLNETVVANVLQVALLAVGWFFLGRKFAMDTLIASLLYPLFTTLLSLVSFTVHVPPMLASFYAGLTGGIGIGLVMRAGASTGGMDIPPLIMHKLTGMKISTLVMITDALTVALGIATYGFDAMLVGLVSVFASGVAIDRTLDAGQGASAKSVQIISDKWPEIMHEIDVQLARGATLIEAQGGFQQDPKKIILCVVSGRQYTTLIGIIRSIDPKAFVITTDASDMHGEGFTYSSPNI
jgi:uncharacterized membrane-anchored protein YitT (DUF2179 family)